MSGLNGGLTMLNEMLSKLPGSEKKAAVYILENPNEVIQYTVFELAEKSNTSNAAIIRLCRSLGLKGFQELKLRIAGDVVKSTETEMRDIQAGESITSIVEKITNNSIHSIQDTADILNIDDIEKAVDVISKAKNIHFFGVGGSFVVALDAQMKFQRIKKCANAYTDLHRLAIQIANNEENDVLVCISFSGETKEARKAMQLANEYNVNSISITGFGTNTISNLADIKLFSSPIKEATFRSGATSTRTAQLHVLDILFMGVATKDYERTIRYVDQTRSAIKSLENK